MQHPNLPAPLVATTATLIALSVPAFAQGVECEAVADALSGSQTEVTASLATEIDPASVEDKELAEGLPALCRVQGTTSPVDGSEIGFEVWLPAEDWNGRLRMFGNGGYSSSMPFDRMSEAAAQGYVAVGTDTGHEGSDPDFAEGNRESIADWGHRAVHESVVQAKAAAEAFYGRAPDYSYFDGCSTGGQQAFSEAQRYPDDFDGIIAGAPGHNRTHLNAGFLWLYLSNHERGQDAEQIVPNHKLPMVADAVFEQCKAQRSEEAGGLASDPFLNDPLSCEPDLQSLVCESGDGEECLTQQEADALSAMYDGVRNPETGERIYFGWPVGSENAGTNEEKPGWSLYWSDFGSSEQPARASFWRVWAFDDPNWSWWEMDLATAMDEANERIAADVNAMDPDLSEFEASGGKMIHYHGLGDPVVPALDSISYYRRVREQMGDPSDFYRLFLVPGMEHCRGGTGANQLDLQPAIEAWVEDGEAPERIVAAHHAGNDPEAEVEFTRPLCPYPQRAFHDGSGPETDAMSFECRPAPEPQYEELGANYLR